MNTVEIVKKARINSKLTQKAFCEYLGKAQATVSKYENGVHRPPETVIIRCIRLIEENDGSEVGIEAEIIQLMKKLEQFNGPGMAKKRALLSELFDALLDCELAGSS